MIDDKPLVQGSGGMTPFGDLLEMDDEKYANFEEKMRQGHISHMSNNTLTFSSIVNEPNLLPIIPHQNSVPHHRRIFSEGPSNEEQKEKEIKKHGDKNVNMQKKRSKKPKVERLPTMSRTITPGRDLYEMKANENIKDDEFIIHGEDENIEFDQGQGNIGSPGTITPFGSIKDTGLKGPNDNHKTGGY